MIVVMIVAWVAVLLAVVNNTYGSRSRMHSFFDRVVASLRKPAVECQGGDGGADDNAAGDREVDLSRQLLNGHLGRAAYRQAMTELAQSGTSRTGPVS